MDDKIVIYQTADGQTSVDVRMDGETVWLSQAQMAELFHSKGQDCHREAYKQYI